MLKEETKFPSLIKDSRSEKAEKACVSEFCQADCPSGCPRTPVGSCLSDKERQYN